MNRNAASACDCHVPFASAPLGRMRHGGSETLARHCHDHPFVTLILGGSYIEAGDEGRRHVGAGDFLVHQPFESHLDRFAPQGADVLVLPLPGAAVVGDMVSGRVSNPDAVVRLAERDLNAASRLLFADAQIRDDAYSDWPDALARELRRTGAFRLGEWAESIGLRPETVSRGFRSAYGTTAKAFRANARARTALAAIRSHRGRLSFLAADLGFADQAHMTRAVVTLTHRPPSAWRTTVTVKS